LPTKDLWFLPKGGPGRQYLLEYEPIRVEHAAKAIAVKMYRKLAAGEVETSPAYSIVLAFSTLILHQLRRSHGVNDEALDTFLERTAERAAACLDMRLPPPIEPEIPQGLVIWLASNDYTSEKALTQTLLKVVG
jgi:hypothetical protein